MHFIIPEDGKGSMLLTFESLTCAVLRGLLYQKCRWTKLLLSECMIL